MEKVSGKCKIRCLLGSCSDTLLLWYEDENYMLRGLSKMTLFCRKDLNAAFSKGMVQTTEKYAVEWLNSSERAA